MPPRLLAAALLGLLACSCREPMETVDLGVGSEVFRVEVARTAEERARGLMGRASLAPNAGMLFVFESDTRLDFWMENTRIPLSIAFLSSSGKITEIREMRPLSREVVSSRLACRYALELNAGAFARAGAGPGDSVVFPEGFR